MVPDSIFGNVEAKGAVFIYSSLAFPWFAGFLSRSLFILSVGRSPGERELLERSLGFLFPGEFLELTSRFLPRWTFSCEVSNPFALITSKGSLCLRAPVSRGLWLLIATRIRISPALRVVHRILYVSWAMWPVATVTWRARGMLPKRVIETGIEAFTKLLFSASWTESAIFRAWSKVWGLENRTYLPGIPLNPATKLARNIRSAFS
jgi:hypothetical protein